MNRNLVLEPFLMIVTLNLNPSSSLISSLCYRLIAGMAMMSLQVVAAEDLRPRRVGTITHLRIVLGEGLQATFASQSE